MYPPIKIYLLGSIDSHHIPPNIFRLSLLFLVYPISTNFLRTSRNNENRKRKNITVYFSPERKIYFHLFPITKCSASIAKPPDMFTSNHGDAFLPSSSSPFIALVLFIQPRRRQGSPRLLRFLFPINWNERIRGEDSPRQSWNIIIRNNSHRRVIRREKGKREEGRKGGGRIPFQHGLLSSQRHRTTTRRE